MNALPPRPRGPVPARALPVPACAVALALAVVASQAACGRPAASTDDWIDAVLAADPIFGGADALEDRLLWNPALVPSGDPLRRRAWLQARRHDHQAFARDVVLNTVSRDLAAAAMPFLTSDAGNALALAFTTSLAAYRHVDESFPAQAVAKFGDPAAVGDAARRSLFEIQASLGSASPSPPLLALLIGAMRVQPDEATAIAAYYATAEGKAWLAIETRVLEAANRQFERFLDDARKARFVRPRFDEVGLRLPLPESLDDPPAKK